MPETVNKAPNLIKRSINFPLSMARRVKLFISMLRYGFDHNLDFAQEHYDFFKKMINDLSRYNLDIQSKRVLEIGCGKSYWLTLLSHSYGAKITGIDTEYTTSKSGIAKYINLMQKNGFERTIRTLIWDSIFSRPYYKKLSSLITFPLDFKNIDVRKMSATDTDFQDSCFDLIISHEVFEHIDDISSTAAELNRILKPDGITYIYVHNFASISGGHHIAWKYPDSEPSSTVPPWDHLRENRFPDIPSWLNELREHEYRNIFEQHMTIVDWLYTHKEGEKLLTDSIRKELSDYSEKELLTKGFIIIAKPKISNRQQA